MYSDRRVPFLRWTSLLALATSAMLTADRLHPGRAFCPLAAACEKARDSALGTLAGIPTSAIGLLAFGSLFLLTLLPLSSSRHALRPSGIVAGVTGATLLLYQGFVIGSFCPLCLVADVAGLACAGAALGWRPPPVRPSGRPLPREPLVTHLRWIALAATTVALPFAWPRDATPSWVPLATPNPLLADLGPLLPDAHAPRADAAPGASAPGAPAGAGPSAPGAHRAHAPALPPIPRLERDARGRVVLPPPAPARATPLLASTATTEGTRTQPIASPRPEESPPWASFTPPRTNPGPDAAATLAPTLPPPAEAAPPTTTPRAAPVRASPMLPPPVEPSLAPEVHASAPTPAALAAADARPRVGIVEYVNAFCPHCRVTHQRLGRVLAGLGVAARVRRVYSWPSDEVPAWARACAHAQDVGREDRFFDELVLAEHDDLGEILAAGRRAGLDEGALRAALASDAPAPRLDRDRRIAGSAGLAGLPTLDIGRRRLLGEQSEGELREAIEAALALRRGAR